MRAKVRRKKRSEQRTSGHSSQTETIRRRFKLRLAAASSEQEREADQAARRFSPDFNRAQAHHTQDSLIDPDIAEAILSGRGGGRTLTESERDTLSAVAGPAGNSVRIHTDDQASRLARSLNARAFTLGNDVFFDRNEFRPESKSGRALIAHEVTHVRQDSRAPAPGPVVRAALRDFGSSQKPEKPKGSCDASRISDYKTTSGTCGRGEQEVSGIRNGRTVYFCVRCRSYNCRSCSARNNSPGAYNRGAITCECND